jgi:predicted amidohydrolase
VLLGRYRKVHLWGPGERAAFVPGQGAPLVVDLGGLRVGVAVCFDVEFPETARAAALAGADVLAVPTAIEDPVVARVLLPARAMENGMALVYANHAAGGQPEGGPAFCGGSVVLAADGSVVATAGSGEELLVADVDAAALAAVRTRNPYVAELRPHLYRAWQDAAQAAPTDQQQEEQA